MRQTDYDETKAREKLQEHKYDVAKQFANTWIQIPT